MSDPTAAAIRVLERQLDQLDPSSAPHGRRLGVEMPRASDYPEPGAFAAELDRRRLAWLEARYAELSAQVARREQAARDRSLGISRFLPPGMTLEHLTRSSKSPEVARELHLKRFERRKAARAQLIERMEAAR